jgi:hypothetical protein
MCSPSYWATLSNKRGKRPHVNKEPYLASTKSNSNVELDDMPEIPQCHSGLIRWILSGLPDICYCIPTCPSTYRHIIVLSDKSCIDPLRLLSEELSYLKPGLRLAELGYKSAVTKRAYYSSSLGESGLACWLKSTLCMKPPAAFCSWQHFSFILPWPSKTCIGAGVCSQFAIACIVIMIPQCMQGQLGLSYMQVSKPMVHKLPVSAQHNFCLNIQSAQRVKSNPLNAALNASISCFSSSSVWVQSLH